ncbi:MAG: hypothetical protein MEP57_01510 [Microvirga sp.]|nr:hypothetical protein [Microvirga sp.]
MNKAVLAGVLVGFMAASSGASANQWLFDLENRSAASITTFRTQENGGWSDNWLEEIVAPGETFEMDFGTDEGECVVRTRIDFTDNTYVDADIDYCDMSTITVRNNDVVWR